MNRTLSTFSSSNLESNRTNRMQKPNIYVNTQRDLKSSSSTLISGGSERHYVPDLMKLTLNPSAPIQRHTNDRRQKPVLQDKLLGLAASNNQLSLETFEDVDASLAPSSLSIDKEYSVGTAKNISPARSSILKTSMYVNDRCLIIKQE